MTARRHIVFRRGEDFQTPALGIVLRWTLVGIQIGRRNYIAEIEAKTQGE